ncbi:MAG TPA: exosortase/archaeosortase family protein [Gemmatimonadales bacterium]|nr:exosortase/archaeosortase family protein [Gemmatimonadales bacterium]
MSSPVATDPAEQLALNPESDSVAESAAPEFVEAQATADSNAATKLPKAKSNFPERVFTPARENLLPVALAAVAFVLLFARPAQLLANDWWNNPEAGHGLLLAPLAIWFAWKSGIRNDAKPNIALGITIIVGAVLLRYMSGLAAELYTMRLSMVGALLGVTVFVYGVRQALHWWLPFVMIWLSVPLPELVTSQLALPLQYKASQMGAALLSWRDIPVRLDGNVILMPGQKLFVAEACSGLRSLTSLIALAVLMGALWLKHPGFRMLLLALAIPIAIVINGIRVFLTGFLVFFVSPEMGTGFMHTTEGWLLFLVSFALIGLAAGAIAIVEKRIASRRANSQVAHA